MTDCANCLHPVERHDLNGCTELVCRCLFDYNESSAAFNMRQLPVEPERARILQEHADELTKLAVSARDSQVGGEHYAKHQIQVWDIWHEYGLGAFEGAILKYLLRNKGSRLQDLKKARHTLDRLIEIEEGKDAP